MENVRSMENHMENVGSMLNALASCVGGSPQLGEPPSESGSLSVHKNKWTDMVFDAKISPNLILQHSMHGHSINHLQTKPLQQNIFVKPSATKQLKTIRTHLYHVACT